MGGMSDVLPVRCGFQIDVRYDVALWGSGGHRAYGGGGDRPVCLQCPAVRRAGEGRLLHR